MDTARFMIRSLYGVLPCGLTKEFDMAAKEDDKLIALSPIERGWIKQALLAQARVLTRARTKEIAGGEVWTIRGREIETVNAIAVKF